MPVATRREPTIAQVKDETRTIALLADLRECLAANDHAGAKIARERLQAMLGGLPQRPVLQLPDAPSTPLRRA